MRNVRGIIATLALLGCACAAPARAAVEIQARVDRNAVAVGEATGLEVTVRGASGGIGDPQFDVPAGIDVIAAGQQQNFSWINGRSSSETVFRYELTPGATGHYAIGPIRVRVGSQLFESPPIVLDVSAASAAPAPGGSATFVAARGGRTVPVSLVVDALPPDPWLGQTVILRVRLVQRARADAPAYDPPPTPGFWSEPPSKAESYFAMQGGDRVLVTETRARLYPLAPGNATIGSATANIVLEDLASIDPLLWARGIEPQREFQIHSAPVRVRVRALPAGAPPAFQGGVGTFRVSWTADRSRTSQDVPVTVRLDVRGTGNLALLRTPELTCDGCEVFASTVADSLSAPGSLAPGRRRFQWNVLARRPGRLALPAPPFAWFDPASGTYQRAALAPIVLDVGPPMFSTGGRETFPSAFDGHPIDPLAPAARPWAFALAGFALAAAIGLWRRPARALGPDPERARVEGWRTALARHGGPEFWRAADESAAWLAARGRAVDDLVREIAGARYGGADVQAEAVQRRVLRELTAALPPPPRPWPRRPVAVVLACAGLAAVALVGPWRGGDARARHDADRADQLARSGEVDRARTLWVDLWKRGARPPGLAARLAWTELRAGGLDRAAVWVLRGERREGRDAALRWMADRVREGGGLTGDVPAHLPMRRIEWAFAAWVLAIVAGVVWPRRALAAAFAALALGAALVTPIEDWRAARVVLAVVRSDTTLEGPGLDLPSGQVVRVLARHGARVDVSAGRGIRGTLAAGVVEPVE